MNAERAIIECILLDLKSISEVYGILKPEMFSNPILSTIYARAKKCYDANKDQADIIILANGDPAATSELISIAEEHTVGFSGEIKTYAKMMAKQYKARQLDKLLHQTKPDPKTVDKQIVELASAIESLDVHQSGSQALSGVIERYAKEMFTQDREQGIKLGYKQLDDILGGLDKGNMVIIAARPSVGKSAISAEITINMAKQGKTVGFYSLEMTNKEIYERLIAHESGININRIRRAIAFNTGEQKMFDEGNDSLKKLNIILADNIRTVSAMQADMKRKHLDVAIIDYAQLILPETRYSGNRTAEVGQISHSVQWAAKKLNIPIILLAQLNRVSATNFTKEPTMSELRESGDFEQDADKIILLWNKSKDRKIKGVKVEKNRQGRTGAVKMSFKGDVMQFEEVRENFKEAKEETPFDNME